jgi:hypothetical protein
MIIIYGGIQPDGLVLSVHKITVDTSKNHTRRVVFSSTARPTWPPSPPPIRGPMRPISKWGPYDRYKPIGASKPVITFATKSTTKLTTTTMMFVPKRHTIFPNWKNHGVSVTQQSSARLNSLPKPRGTTTSPIPHTQRSSLPKTINYYSSTSTYSSTALEVSTSSQTTSDVQEGAPKVDTTSVHYPILLEPSQDTKITSMHMPILDKPTPEVAESGEVSSDLEALLLETLDKLASQYDNNGTIL